MEVGTNCMLFRDGNHAVRLLKKAPNFVLSSSKSSMVPRRVRLPVSTRLRTRWMAFLSSLTEIICIIRDHEIIAKGLQK